MNTEFVPLPEIVTDEHLQFLDDLRQVGTVNMMGAGAFLESEFGLSPEEASEVLDYWLKTLGSRQEEVR